MIGAGSFLDLIDDELGLRFTAAELDKRFDELGEWDSVQLLRLVGVLEHETGKTISLPDLVEARTLREIYELAASA